MTSKVKYNFYSDRTLNKYYKNEFEQYHRKDGPAIEYTNGTKYWYKNGIWHREDGPAIVYTDGRHQYYLGGSPYSKKDYWEEIEKNKKEREIK